MDFNRLLEIVQDEPVFDTGLLLAGDSNPRDVRRQLSRWKQYGKIYQLRRGLVALLTQENFEKLLGGRCFD